MNFVELNRRMDKWIGVNEIVRVLDKDDPMLMHIVPYDIANGSEIIQQNIVGSGASGQCSLRDADNK